MNLLQSALNQISGLVKNQKVTIQTHVLQNVRGVVSYEPVHEVEVYCHLQPVTPVELKKFTDSTINSAIGYKFFFLDDSAKIINSAKIKIESSFIRWGEKKFRAFAVRDWFLINGWICVYGSLIEDGA